MCEYYVNLSFKLSKLSLHSELCLIIIITIINRNFKLNNRLCLDILNNYDCSIKNKTKSTKKYLKLIQFFFFLNILCQESI